MTDERIPLFERLEVIARRISVRARTIAGRYLVALDRRELADVLVLIDRAKKPDPAPPVAGSTDSLAPVTPTGLVATVSWVAGVPSVGLVLDPPCDVPVGGYASGMRRTQFYRGAATLGSPINTTPGLLLSLTATDLGGALNGSSSQSNADWTVASGGASFYGATPDSHRFVGSLIAGNLTLIARVPTYTGSNEYSQACLVIRETLATNAKYAAAVRFPSATGRGANMEYRATTGGAGGQTTRRDFSAGTVWLKLTRVGHTFSTYYSTDGNGWVFVGTVDIVMSDGVYAGVAVCRNDANATTAITAVFEQLAITNLASPTLTDSAVTSGNTYVYTAKNEDLAGNVSAQTSTTVTVTPLTSFVKPPFPRLGITWYGSENWTANTARKQWFAKHHIAVPSIWPNYNADYNAQFAEIKGYSNRTAWLQTYKTKIFGYLNPESTGLAITDFPSASHPSVWTKVNAENWWVRTSWPAGSVCRSFFSTTQATTNLSSSCQVDGGGKKFSEYFAAESWSLHTGKGQIDGVMSDNWFSCPRIESDTGVQGDWNRNGTAESDVAAASILRAGMVEFATAYKTELGSAKYFFGNIDYNLEYTKGRIGGSLSPEYSGVLHGGFCEYFTSGPYAEHNYYDMATLIANYRHAMSHSAEPKLVVIAGSVGADGVARTMRHGLTFTLLDDGYYGLHGGAPDYYFPEEYVFQLGNRVGAVPTAAYQSGVWRADFDNGIALNNPRANGTPTVTLGGTFYALRNGGEAWLTPGASYTQITFPNDRDGIILSRTAT